MAQALYTLMEKDIEISGRKEDQDLIEKAAKEAVEEFQKEAKYEIKYTVDDDLAAGR